MSRADNLCGDFASWWLIWWRARHSIHCVTCGPLSIGGQSGLDQWRTPSDTVSARGWFAMWPLPSYRCHRWWCRRTVVLNGGLMCCGQRDIGRSGSSDWVSRFWRRRFQRCWCWRIRIDWISRWPLDKCRENTNYALWAAEWDTLCTRTRPKKWRINCCILQSGTSLLNCGPSTRSSSSRNRTRWLRSL